ncbi:MAG: hypothetical protein R2843_08620 [Thermomicrobiales bacterium]
MADLNGLVRRSKKRLEDNRNDGVREGGQYRDAGIVAHCRSRDIGERFKGADVVTPKMKKYSFVGENDVRLPTARIATGRSADPIVWFDDVSCSCVCVKPHGRPRASRPFSCSIDKRSGMMRTPTDVELVGQSGEQCRQTVALWFGPGPETDRRGLAPEYDLDGVSSSTADSTCRSDQPPHANAPTTFSGT